MAIHCRSKRGRLQRHEDHPSRAHESKQSDTKAMQSAAQVCHPFFKLGVHGPDRLTGHPPGERVMEAVESIIITMRKASYEERESLKAQLMELASGPDGVNVRDAIESKKRGELLEIQWDLEEIIEATTPQKAAAPPPKKEEPKKEDPNRPLTSKDLVVVYDDPRGIMLHKSKVGERWFLTQMDPRSGQPQTIELRPHEVQAVQQQLAGSPYWVIGSGAGSMGGGSSAGPGAPAGAIKGHPRR